MRGGVFLVEDNKECDFCDEKKKCASINWLNNNVIIVCR